MTYTAPIADIHHALKHAADMPGLVDTGAFEDLSDDLIGAVLEEAGKLANDVLAPLNWVGDQEGATLENGVVRTATGFPDAYRQYVDGGWMGICFPEDHGGGGLPRAMALAVSEMMQASNMAFGLGPMLTLGAIEALLEWGTPQQQQTYLPKLVTGEWTGTMNLTEPHAGSDLGLLRTKAEPVGDGSYKISGQKIWITWGEHDCADNIIHLVLARLPDAPAGVKGISLFLVPKFLVKEDGSLGDRNDVRCIGLDHKMGIHASPTCVMSYGDDEGAIGWLVGPEHGGMRAMFTMMNSARVNVGQQGVAIAERAYQRALAFAQDRKQGRTPDGEAPGAIVKHPDVARMLMRMRSKILAGRGICFQQAVAADIAEHGADEEARKRAKRREEWLTPVAKAWCTDLGIEATGLGVQVHGGTGFIEETGAAQHYRDARIATIYEGTNGIQAIDLTGRKLSMEGGAAAREFFEEVRAVAAKSAAHADPRIAELGRALEASTAEAEAATAWLADPARETQDRLAGATVYQDLIGDVAGGASLAAQAIAAVEGDDPQRVGDAALFFARDVLALSAGKASAARMGANAIFGAKALEAA